MLNTILIVLIAIVLVIAATACFQPEFFRRRPVADKSKYKNRVMLRRGKPVDGATLRKMAAAHMERVMTKGGWKL